MRSIATGSKVRRWLLHLYDLRPLISGIRGLGGGEGGGGLAITPPLITTGSVEYSQVNISGRRIASSWFFIERLRERDAAGVRRAL